MLSATTFLLDRVGSVKTPLPLALRNSLSRRAARAAGVVPIGVVAPGEDFEFAREVLTEAGASRVLNRLNEIEEVLS